MHLYRASVKPDDRTVDTQPGGWPIIGCQNHRLERRRTHSVPAAWPAIRLALFARSLIKPCICRSRSTTSPATTSREKCFVILARALFPISPGPPRADTMPTASSVTSSAESVLGQCSHVSKNGAVTTARKQSFYSFPTRAGSGIVRDPRVPLRPRTHVRKKESSISLPQSASASAHVHVKAEGRPAAYAGLIAEMHAWCSHTWYSIRKSQPTMRKEERNHQGTGRG